MRKPLELDAKVTAACLLGVFAAACFPLHNPDVFWHLAIGRAMADSGGWLYREPLAMPGPDGRGLPWIGFEWLSELLFYRLWQAGGWVGLVAVKALLAAACAFALDSALRRRRVRPELRAFALAAWAALSQKRWMLEPELFTFLFLALLWRRIDSGAPWTRRGALAWAGLFALWANLHGGFIYGLGLLALSLARGGRPWPPKLGLLALCFAATLANPHGGRAYFVALHLLGDMARLRAGNIEWMSPALLPGWLPKLYFAAPLAGLYFLFRREREGNVPEPGLLLILAAFGLWGGLSFRSIAVAAVVVVPIAARLAAEDPAVVRALRAPAASGALLTASLLGFAGLVVHAAPLGRPWHGVSWKSYPRELTEAAARLVPHGTLYAPFDWAAWPAWRFYPERKIYAYGRLDVFRERLEKAADARALPFGWAEFLEREGVEAALEKPPRQRFPGIVDRPGRRGSVRLDRSPFAAYYPRDRWALAWWNEEGFLFVRKRPGVRDWLDPTDLDYLRLAASDGALDRRRACVESAEHRALAGPSRFDAALTELCGRAR